MRARVIKLAATLASIVILATSTPVMAQVPEGGAIRNKSVDQEFAGLPAVISHTDVSREIQKYVGRGGTLLEDITFTVENLHQVEYTFTFRAANGEWIGSSSFTAIARTDNHGNTTIEIVHQPDLESVPGAQ